MNIKEALKRPKGRLQYELWRHWFYVPRRIKRRLTHSKFIDVSGSGDFQEYFLVDEWTSNNVVTDESADNILDVYLSGGTQITTWYVVLSESATSPATTMTYAVPGFTEVTTAVDEATRQQWVDGGVSSKSVDNSASKAVYTFNASKTIYGSGLVGGGSAASTKGDTAGGGMLHNYSQFGSSRAVVSSDVLNITITCTMADDGV